MFNCSLSILFTGRTEHNLEGVINRHMILFGKPVNDGICSILIIAEFMKNIITSDIKIPVPFIDHNGDLKPVAI